MKLLLLMILSVGLFGCDYQLPATRKLTRMQERYDSKMSTLKYLVRSVESLRETFFEANIKCIELGKCYKQKSKIFAQNLVLESKIDKNGWPHERVVTPFKQDCQIGKHHFEFEHLDAAIKSCLIANKKCDEERCKR